MSFTACIVALAGAFQQENSGSTQVLLRAEVEVARSSVRLADVAEIRGKAQDIERLSMLALGEQPAPDTVHRITPSGVLLAARLAGVALERDQIKGAPQALVTGSYRSIDRPQLLRKIKDFITTQISPGADHMLVEPLHGLTSMSVPRDGGLPEQQIEWSSQPVAWGRAQVRIHSIYQDGTTNDQTVTLKIRRFGRLLRLSQAVEVGEAVGRQHTMLLEAELTKLPLDIVRSSDQLAGLVARRRLEPGQPIKKSDLESPVLVRRGDSLLVQLQNGGLRITANAVAQQSGRKGDRVMARNRRSKQLLTVRLLRKNSAGRVLATLE